MLCDCVTARLRRPLPPHDRRDLGMAKEKCLGWCRCCALRASSQMIGTFITSERESLKNL